MEPTNKVLQKRTKMKVVIKCPECQTQFQKNLGSVNTNLKNSKNKIIFCSAACASRFYKTKRSKEELQLIQETNIMNTFTEILLTEESSEKLTCKFCKKIWDNPLSKRNHETLCKLNPNPKLLRPVKTKKLKCSMCNKDFLNLKLHEPYCKNNPDRKKGNNGYTKAKQKNKTFKHTEEARKKISEKSKTLKHTKETKKKLSLIAKKRNLGGFSRSKKHYNGYKLGSSYEVTVAKSLDANNIKWEQCKRFTYIDSNGVDRTYTPDFYLPDYNIYLEPKNDYLINNINPGTGIKDTEKIKLASEQNNIKVLILNKEQLEWDVIKYLIQST